MSKWERFCRTLNENAFGLAVLAFLILIVIDLIKAIRG